MTHFTPVFWIVFAALLFIIVYCDLKFNLLRDQGTNNDRPYSWARVQLAWWMLIVLSSMISIIICSTGNQIPTLDSSTLILLGITTGTTAAARVIDTSNQKKPGGLPDDKREYFFLDILSDNDGVNLHRLQTVIFNFVFGVWFIHYVLTNCSDPCPALHLVAPSASLPSAGTDECVLKPWNYIMPVISQNNLILLGLSSATYAALKTTESTKSSSAKSSTQTSPPSSPPSLPPSSPPASPPSSPPFEQI